jgi:CheY-like chemotaxis protein
MESTPTILLVEDNEEDVFLLQRALRRHKIDCALHVAEDGEAAIDYLAGNAKFADRTAYPLPTLMLLDLKLPYVHGLEVLEWVAAHLPSQIARTIVLTSSGEDRDRERVERFGVRRYFEKPPSDELLAAVAKSLEPSLSRAAE